VREASAFCADSLSDGWQQAVADRAADYAQTAWERLSRSRRKRNCKALADIARSILAAKTQIHKSVGGLFGWAAGALGAGDPAQAFYQELMSNIPLPIDAKIIAVARGVQVAGILLCVMDGRDLAKCECFRDLALAEAKERVGQILVAAMSDWTSLKTFAAGPAPVLLTSRWAVYLRRSAVAFVAPYHVRRGNFGPWPDSARGITPRRVLPRGRSYRAGSPPRDTGPTSMASARHTTCSRVILARRKA
jgi:hypothetical protein